MCAVPLWPVPGKAMGRFQRAIKISKHLFGAELSRPTPSCGITKKNDCTLSEISSNK